MEITQYRAFLAVARELHFGRASEALHMAQPHVTRLVRRLEEALEATLFERTTRKVVLTEAGAALLPLAAEIVEADRRVRLTVRQTLRGESGRVRIGYAGASTLVVVSKLAKRARAEYPGIRMELNSAYFAHNTIDRLLSQELDIGFGRWETLPPGLNWREVENERLVVAMPESHRLARRDGVHLAELRDEQFVSLPHAYGSLLTDRLRQLSNAAGFAAEVVQFAADTWTLLSLVAAEIGLTLTVSSVVPNAPAIGVRFVEVLDQYEPVYMRMAWRESDSNAALARILELSRLVIPRDEEPQLDREPVAHPEEGETAAEL